VGRPVTVGAGRDELLRARRHVVLSPHYDDMALSLGGSMALAAADGADVVDLILFGSDPVGIELHAFARGMHEAWGLEADAVIAGRRAEEASAVRALGARTDGLPFLDAIYRGTAYLSDDDLFGTPSSQDAELPRLVASAVERWSAALEPVPTRLYAPLGVGNHVDHQAARAAAKVLHDAGADVWLYEDLPYALFPEARDRVVAGLARGPMAVTRHAEVDVEETWERKLDAIMAYPSQLETVFRHYVGVEPDRDGIGAALAAYHRGTAGGPVAERFWRFAGPGPVLGGDGSTGSREG
jgi:LmbE family N-acetylglucosaminyl deacetylase